MMRSDFGGDALWQLGEVQVVRQFVGVEERYDLKLVELAVVVHLQWIQLHKVENVLQHGTIVSAISSMGSKIWPWKSGM
jgi:hypothetical protein